MQGIHNSISKYMRSEVYNDRCLIFRLKNMHHLKFFLHDYSSICFLFKKMAQVYDLIQTKSEGNTRIVWPK